MSFYTIFKNIKPVNDSREQLRFHLLWFLFIRVILFTLLLGITILLQSRDRQVILPPSSLVLAFITFIYIFSILSALVLQKKNINLQRFGRIQVLSDTVFITLLVYATGCSQSIFTSVFILPILAGGLIMHRIGGLIPAAAATLLYGVILTLEYQQIIPSYFTDYRYILVNDYQVSTNIFAVYGLTFFLIAMLSGLIARKLRTAEEALSRTEQRLDRILLLYKQIFDNIITGILTLDSTGKITSLNPAARDITGYSAEEVTGRSFNTFFPRFSTDTKKRHVNNFRRKDGKNIRIGYTCSELRVPTRVQSGNPPISSSRIITLQDISKIEQMEQQVRNAEKMAAIGELSASIAHDFRNPLAAIFGSAQILATDCDNKSERSDIQHDLINIILRESERMADTITDFLHYARPLDPTPQWFNLKRMVRETIDQLASDRRVSSACEINVSVPDDLDVNGDRQLLQIALAHVLRNSCHASKNPAKSIVLSAEEAEKPGGESIIIEIADMGTGIDPEIRDKIFDPFFTTREDTAGLGLAVVKQIVDNHRGTIEIISKKNQGCTVIIVLPQPRHGEPAQQE
jgi:two-component system sensor histidine kinase PilS (NtrC family)